MTSLSISESRRRLLHGLIPAVPVPFCTSGALDATAHEQYAVYMAKQEIAGVAVWAHTGRGLLLKRDDKIRILRDWSTAIGPERVLIAGVGSSLERRADPEACVNSALRMASDALENGAQALLVFPPAPFGDGDERRRSVLEYHKRLATLGAPLILFYLYEAAGGISYSPPLLRELLTLPQVVGIKLATLDSVMTYQDIATTLKQEFPEKLLITGEDRFLGYSLMCGADAALVGIGATCTALQRALLDAHYGGQAVKFLTLSRAVDDLAKVLFREPMEGYIGRVLCALSHEGVIGCESCLDPWGPPLPKPEFAAIGDVVRRLPGLEGKQGE